MCAGPRFEYHWQDSNSAQFKKPTKMSAPDYVDCLMTWVQAQLDDENVFPSKIGEFWEEDWASWEAVVKIVFVSRFRQDVCHSSFPFGILILSNLFRFACYLSGVPFPSNFQATIKSILRRLFRVYAHIYNHHFAQICALSIEGESSLKLCFPSNEKRAKTCTLLCTNNEHILICSLLSPDSQLISTHHIVISYSS